MLPGFAAPNLGTCPPFVVPSRNSEIRRPERTYRPGGPIFLFEETKMSAVAIERANVQVAEGMTSDVAWCECNENIDMKVLSVDEANSSVEAQRASGLRVRNHAAGGT